MFPDLVFMKGIILEMKVRSFWESSSSMIIVGKWMSQDRLHYQVYIPHLKIKCFPYCTKLTHDLKSIKIRLTNLTFYLSYQCYSAYVFGIVSECNSTHVSNNTLPPCSCRCPENHKKWVSQNIGSSLQSWNRGEISQNFLDNKV